MPKTARHVATDAPACQCAPEKRDGQAGGKMDKGHQPYMEERQQAFPSMQPLRVVEPFEEQENTAGGNSQVMPVPQVGEGDMEHAAAEKYSGNSDMRGSHDDGEPPHPSRGAGGFSACCVMILPHLLFRLVQILSFVWGSVA